MSLIRLVYFSKNNIWSGGPAAFHLKQILASAIANNVRVGVTGGLVFNRKHFFQVLEGDSAAVTKIFAAISNDPRHKDVVLVKTKPVAERLFGEWSMGFASAAEMIEEAETGLGGNFDPNLLTSDQMVAMILELVKKKEGIASSAKIAAA